MSSHTPTLPDLPTELLLSIFSHACVASHLTGRSITLVCKAFRGICLDTGVDIRCVAVFGAERMARFLEMLNGRDVCGRGVSSLLLVDDEQSPQTHVHDAAHTDLLSSILRTISPSHLRILHLSYPYTFNPLPLLPSPFPALRELTLAAPLLHESFASSLPAPALTRLRLRSCIRVPEDLGAQLIRICPRLRDLSIEVNRISLSADFTLRFVQAYCGLQHTDSIPSSILMPPDLRRVTLSFAPFVISRGFNALNARFGLYSSVSQFDSLAEEAKAAGIRVPELRDLRGVSNGEVLRVGEDERGDAGPGGHERTLVVLPVPKVLDSDKWETYRAREGRVLLEAWIEANARFL